MSLQNLPERRLKTLFFTSKHS